MQRNAFQYVIFRQLRGLWASVATKMQGETAGILDADDDARDGPAFLFAEQIIALIQAWIQIHGDGDINVRVLIYNYSTPPDWYTSAYSYSDSEAERTILIRNINRNHWEPFTRVWDSRDVSSHGQGTNFLPPDRRATCGGLPVWNELTAVAIAVESLY